MTEVISRSIDDTLDKRLLLLSPQDNIVVARKNLRADTVVTIEGGNIRLPGEVSIGFKIARTPIGKGEKILKYGAPIGSATQDITRGELVHSHNMKSDYLNIGEENSADGNGEARCVDG